MRAPDFWEKPNLIARVLAPAGWVYSAAGAIRERLIEAYDPGVPIVCVGNAVVGGAGKTPLTFTLAKLLSAQNPHALSRGYGGSMREAVRVDPAIHTHREVGDEPLLLAEAMPVWTSKNRCDGAKAAVESGAGLLIMDDGLQNPSLRKQVSLLVVDSHFGAGNGFCLPAGPLREPMRRAVGRCDAVVLIGDGPYLPEHAPRIFRATVVPDNGAQFFGRQVFAFAGIGRPRKFYASLAECGAQIAGTMDFADHHSFSGADLSRIAEAAPESAVLVTTAKDWVRLPRSWQEKVEVLRVSLTINDERKFADLIWQLIARQ